MYKLFLTIFLIITISSLRAQEDFLTIHIEEKNFGSYDAGFIDSNGHSALVFRNNKYLLVYPFDDQGELSEKLRIRLRDNSIQDKFHACVYSQGLYYFYFSNRSDKDYKVLSYNTVTKYLSNRKLDIDLAQKKTVTTFTLNGKFIILSVNKKDATLNLFSIDGQEVSNSNYEFEDINLKTNLLSSILKQEDSFNLIWESAANNLYNSHRRNKIYVSSNSIVFTFDELNKTFIRTIDLNSWDYTINDVDHEEFDTPYQSVNYNSFVKGGKLYVVKSDLNRLIFYIQDIKSKEIVFANEFSKSGDISFANGNAIQEKGTENLTLKSKELLKPKQFLKKINSSKLAISVIENTSKTLEVTIGSYKIPVQLNTGTPVPGLAISLSDLTTLNSSFFFAYEYTPLSKSSFFRSILDSDNYQHLPKGETQRSPWSEMKRYEVDIGPKTINKGTTREYKTSGVIPEVKVVYKWNDRHLLGYYDRYKKEYYLKSFQLRD